MIPMQLTAGDKVLVTYKGLEVDALVVLASENNESLALVMDAILGGYVGMILLLWDKGAYKELINNEVVIVMKLPLG